MLIEDDIHPEELMSAISDTSIIGKLAFSLLIHILLVGLTSIGFIGLCVKHKTLDPRTQIAAEKEEAERKGKEQAKAKRKAEALQKTKETKRALRTDVNGKARSPGTSRNTPKKTPVEKRISEKSDRRPESSDLGLDLDDM